MTTSRLACLLFVCNNYLPNWTCVWFFCIIIIAFVTVFPYGVGVLTDALFTCRLKSFLISSLQMLSVQPPIWCAVHKRLLAPCLAAMSLLSISYHYLLPTGQTGSRSRLLPVKVELLFFPPVFLELPGHLDGILLPKRWGWQFSFHPLSHQRLYKWQFHWCVAILQQWNVGVTIITILSADF